MQNILLHTYRHLKMFLEPYPSQCQTRIISDHLLSKKILEILIILSVLKRRNLLLF